jgi:hypothetical protein
MEGRDEVAKSKADNVLDDPRWNQENEDCRKMVGRWGPLVCKCRDSEDETGDSDDDPESENETDGEDMDCDSESHEDEDEAEGYKEDGECDQS